MIQSTQFSFDKLKKDLVEKEHLIEEKNREILRLRMAAEESTAQGYSRGLPPPSSYPQVSGEQRGQLVMDLSYAIDQLRAELTRIKQSMFAQIGKHINFEGTPHIAQVQRMISTEEDLHSEVIIQLSEIRALLGLSQEIGMLASSSLTAQPAFPQQPRQRSASPSQGSIAKPAKASQDSNY